MIETPAHLDFRHLKGKRLHLGVCGSISAYRLPDIMRRWQQAGLQCSATLTRAAERFITPLTFEALGASPVYGDAPDVFMSPFGHLEPGQTADAMVIAPASANTINRLAAGLADNMLCCQALAFSGPLVIAPAMNPRMWIHPATSSSVAALTGRGAEFVLPACGGTACGDEGQGKLADPREIFLAALNILSPKDMRGLKVLITLGPTREKWDAVRFWSNPSSGTMGAALAVACHLRGAEVHAVCGPTDIWLPGAINRYNTVSAREMYERSAELWPGMDAGIFTAAVADFSPEPHGPEKFKKAGAVEGFSIKFKPNADILKNLASGKGKRKVVGFAAETVADLPAAVKIKLASKGADMIVGNSISVPGSGFGSATNAVFVADTSGRAEEWPNMPKAEVAYRICSWLLSL